MLWRGGEGSGTSQVTGEFKDSWDSFIVSVCLASLPRLLSPSYQEGHSSLLGCCALYLLLNQFTMRPRNFMFKCFFDISNIKHFFWMRRGMPFVFLSQNEHFLSCLLRAGTGKIWKFHSEFHKGRIPIVCFCFIFLRYFYDFFFFCKCYEDDA